MSFEKAYQYLEAAGMADRVLKFSVSSATVELAAAAVGCAPAHIAKSLTFMTENGPVMIVCAGDAKVSNQKYKAAFGTKAKMLTREEVTACIGHDVGGVCPFGILDGVKVYLDSSLRRFEYVYPACGDASSAVKLTPEELARVSGSSEWTDVCTIPEEG